MQDLNFITQTVAEMTSRVESTETVNKIIGTANQYAQVKKFPASKELWSDEQVGAYLDMIERMLDLPTEFTQGEFEAMSIQEKLSAAGIETVDITNGPQTPEGIVGEVVNQMAEQNKYRDDLKCPYCQQMVYDNRNSKRSDKSPDFTCSTNDPTVCGGHTGKWRKSWWIDNSDIPEEWGI